MALIDDKGDEAAAAIAQAGKLGFDPDRLIPLTGIHQARAGKINEAEPMLREAFDRKQEPSIEVAKELARIYLSSYRLPQAAVAIERWRTLDPRNPKPYMWSNEVGSRSDVEPSILIRNYQAALERDPNLDKARLGLAEQLSKERRFDEAEQEYLEYLRRNPKDASALVGLGRNAFQDGDLDGATKCFEEALKIDPRQPEALKELAQTDLRLGHFATGVPAVRGPHPDRPLRSRDPLFLRPVPEALRQRGAGPDRERAGGSPPQGTRPAPPTPVQYPPGPERPGIAIRSRQMVARTRACR